ncbi:hypothetical protein [Succinimonas amylolytica]|uniref:hypothetical protein n=1 Tax=Succinimonas amylolytica TaxID=83769 RepID=UPI00037E0549|nr:hypothetical protein [Succinimonas amylolytica]
MRRSRLDLYRPEFRPKKVILSIEHMIIVWLCVAGIIALLIMNASEENRRIKKQEQELNEQLSDTQAQLAEVQARVAVQQLDKVLQKEVQDLKVLVDSKRKMYELISSSDKLKSHGYAGFMYGLAEVSSSDISVTSFRLSGLNANISGIASRSDSVPQLVSRFGVNENMKDVTFGALRIYTDSETGILHFSLSDAEAVGGKESEDNGESEK